MSTLHFTSQPSFAPAARVIIGDKSLFNAESLQLPNELSSVISLIKSDKTKEASVFVKEDQYSLVSIEDTRKRNLGSIRVDLLEASISKHVPKDKNTELTVLCSSKAQVKPAAIAVARSFPIFNKKSKDAGKERTIAVKFHCSETVSAEELQAVQKLADGVRNAARLVDTPTCFLYTHSYLEEVKKLVEKHPSIKLTYYKDEDVKEQGMGALYAVGQAAVHGSVFVLLEYQPESVNTDVHLAYVGKGICYDTGGLSLKPTTGMSSMKGDMGGSAAVLNAFHILATSNYQGRVSAILCIAENAIGPKSYRNDDIITSLSGKTIEINNTDAEGRVVLSDGVAYATQKLKPTHLIDVATLTGAQLIATGVYHAGLLSNDEDFEHLVYKAGQSSGDYCYPILYAPEILNSQFDSKVADMKNSVKDRANAQSSCAGHFIESHFDPEWKGKWAHLDMAGPSWRNERGTGACTALLVEIAHKVLEGSKV